MITPKRLVYLIEWKTKTGWSELGGEWEADHNSGIWFTKEGANSAMKERLSELPPIYDMRVTPYIPVPEPQVSGRGKDELSNANM